jgi:hypothetical protein
MLDDQLPLLMYIGMVVELIRRHVCFFSAVLTGVKKVVVRFTKLAIRGRRRWTYACAAVGNFVFKIFVGSV